MKSTRLTLPLIALTLLIAACGKSPTPTDRAGRLLTMAGEEAANIPNVLDRFTRQLNIADTLLRTGRKPDAAKTLGLARDTLNIAKKEDFDDFHRIAAWTAISQLARAADDRVLALTSSDLAVAALNDVQPPAERPQYVLSLAAEIADLRGNSAAIELLDSGGAWAAAILNADNRRVALIAFSDRLLSYEGYENARTMLHRDPDPAWRTDTFLALAGGLQQAPDSPANDRLAHNKTATPPGSFGGRGGAYATAAPSLAVAEAAPATSPADQSYNNQLKFRQAISQANNYGKDVRFENVYKQSN